MRTIVIAAVIAAIASAAPASAAPAASVAGPSPAPASAAAPRTAEPGYGKPEGILPGVVFGPKLSIVNLPAPAVGLEAKFLNLFGASVDYGLIPDLTLRGVKMSLTEWSVGAKLYPFRGRFFLGAAYGSRTFKGSKVDHSTGTPLEAKVDVTSTYLAPGLGWRFVQPGGFFMGIDLGWQFVVHSRTKVQAPAGVSDSDLKDVKDMGRRVGKAGLPAVGLLELGFFL